MLSLQLSITPQDLRDGLKTSLEAKSPCRQVTTGNRVVITIGPVVHEEDGKPVQRVSVSKQWDVRIVIGSNNYTLLCKIDREKPEHDEIERVCYEINRFALISQLWDRLDIGTPMEDTREYCGFVFYITVRDGILTLTDTKNAHNEIAIRCRNHNNCSIKPIIYDVYSFIIKLNISKHLQVDSLTNIVMQYQGVYPKPIFW